MQTGALILQVSHLGLPFNLKAITLIFLVCSYPSVYQLAAGMIQIEKNEDGKSDVKELYKIEELLDVQGFVK